jgi:hypothetical protein
MSFKHRLSNKCDILKGEKIMKYILIFTAKKEETAKKIYDELESRRIADLLTKKPLVGGRCIYTPYTSILCTNDMHLIASKSIRFDRIFVLEPSHCSDNLSLFLQNKTYQSIIIMPSFNQMIEEICNMSKDEWLVDEYCNHDIEVTDKLYTNLRIGVLEPAISIKNVIFNHPATIVFWTDGTKTVVKAQDGDIFDPEKGLAMAISKKALGNKGNYCNELKKWLPKKEETMPPITMSELADNIEKFSKKVKEVFGGK